jgi:hypothetical protein
MQFIAHIFMHFHRRSPANFRRSLGTLVLLSAVWHASAEKALAGPGVISASGGASGFQAVRAEHTIFVTHASPAFPSVSAARRDEAGLIGLVALPAETVKILLTGGLLILIGAICLPYLIPYCAGNAPKAPGLADHIVALWRAVLPGPRHSLASAAGMVEGQTLPIFQRPGPRPYLLGKRPKPVYPRPGDRILSSSPKRQRQLPSEAGVVEAFFQQSGFGVTGVSDTELLISSQLPRYKHYGTIPVYVMKNAVVDERHIQTIRSKQRKPAQAQALAFLIVNAPLEESAYQAIYHCQTAENFTIIPLSYLLVAKSVRHASCAQQLEEKMSASTGSSNLYAMSTPVADPLNFFGRTKIMNQLLSAIGQQQQLAVFGAPKIGKTWLFWQLKERLSAHITIYVDLQQLPKSCSYLYRKIIDECARDIGFKYPELSLPELQLSWAGTSHGDGPKFIHDILALWQCAQQKQAHTQIILLLDGAENLLPDVDSAGQCDPRQRRASRAMPDGAQSESGLQAFMATVQQILARQACVTTMLAFASPQALRAPFPKHWRCDRKIALSSLTEEQCNGMITALGAQMGLRYPEETLSRLYYETGGHPYVTRQVCSLIAKNVRRSKMIPAAGSAADACITVQVRDVELAITEYVEYKSEYLEEFWRQLLPAEQDVLRMIMQADSCTRHDLTQCLHAHAARDQQQHILQCLTANDLIEQCEGKYAMKMGLFERIIQPQP